ncbi:MAG: hypothetical protein WDM88_04985 [Galbitalea sp.]
MGRPVRRGVGTAHGQQAHPNLRLAHQAVDVLLLVGSERRPDGCPSPDHDEGGDRGSLEFTVHMIEHAARGPTPDEGGDDPGDDDREKRQYGAVEHAQTGRRREPVKKIVPPCHASHPTREVVKRKGPPGCHGGESVSPS